MAFRIFRWIKTWKIESIFEKRSETENISLIDAISKGIEISKNVEEWICGHQKIQLVDYAIPDYWDSNITENMKFALPFIISNLLLIKTKSVESFLKDYKFPDEFHKDKFYSDLAKTCAYVLADGKLSFQELTIVTDIILNEYQL